jgi:HEAT repeat protein
MDLQEITEKFKSLTPEKKSQFLQENIHVLKEEKKIIFLHSVIKNRKYSPLVRASALRSLSQTSYQESGIFQQYIKDRSPEVASAAKKALQELRSKKDKGQNLSQLVLRKIRSCVEKERKLKIIKSIINVKGNWVSEVLLEALDDPSEEVRDLIIKELGEKGDISLNMIYPRMLRPPWYVKSSVLKILAIRKNPRFINLIGTLINDSNAEVRRSAAEALGQIGGETALIFLNKLAKDNNQFVRKSAEEALNKASQLKFS